ncbi:MAG: thioredoxin family protein [Bdellovibrionales bacterium]|nr:thioredoxin family protein [Bdellovibrionales bacterium]
MMLNNRSLLALFLIAILFLLGAVSVHAATKVDQPHVKAELVTEHLSVTPGVDETFGLKLTIDPKWHVYWKYAGDSGSAPALNWEVNGNSIATEILWPIPERIEVGPFVNFGYQGEILLMADLPIPEDATGAVQITLDAEWLVCEEECIPGNAFFELEMQVSEGSLPSPSTEKALFEKTRTRLPSNGDGVTTTVRETDEGNLILNIQGIQTELNSIYFFPAEEGIVENSAEQSWMRSASAIDLILTTPKSIPRPREFSGVLVKNPPFKDGSLAKEIRLPFSALSGNTQVESTSGAPDGLSTSNPKNETKAFALILLAAFLGGLILNLMPCVFPVLAIKILSFVKKAGKAPHQVRNHGLAFGCGILVSFWLLAIVVRILRETGEKLGWGFQLQNPSFVAILILLLVAVALNLFGTFEFGSSIQRISGSLDKDGESYSNSFLSGVLATLLATPCTAPFMGGAVAYGIQAQLFPSLVVFSFLALGLASPYLILSFYPRLLASLPKPGAWMETFKQFMGFPVLLTALWLLWVFNKQNSPDALLALLLSSLLFAFSLWIYGKICPPTAPRRRQIYGMLFVICAFSLCSWIGIPYSNPSVQPASAVEIDTDSALVSGITAHSERDSYGQTWYAFSPVLVDTLVAEGKPVYVDFTAAWCITCQVNKRVVFGSEKVRKTLSEKGIVLVKGDWTNEDPIITEALEKFGRLGVPLNILYKPDDRESPVVFPNILTPQLVLEELEKL